jgi:hypothetical protein
MQPRQYRHWISVFLALAAGANALASSCIACADVYLLSFLVVGNFQSDSTNWDSGLSLTLCVTFVAVYQAMSDLVACFLSEWGGIDFPEQLEKLVPELEHWSEECLSTVMETTEAGFRV